jgi:hypothetical protein
LGVAVIVSRTYVLAAATVHCLQSLRSSSSFISAQIEVGMSEPEDSDMYAEQARDVVDSVISSAQVSLLHH